MGAGRHAGGAPAAKVAVIGAGIGGLGAAWALARNHDVVVYDAERRLGGHANTVEIADGGRRIAVDTGFIVYNERNYPNLVRLFADLGVPTEPSDMSFSVSRRRGRFEYQARALGLLTQPSNLTRPAYRRMVRDIVRFTREAPSAIGSGSTETIDGFLDRLGLSEDFRRDFLLPVVACIWSSSFETMRGYPAEAMVRFLDNHGLLNVLERPAWRTVTGGSRSYVSRIADALGPDVRIGRPVLAVRRGPHGVTVHDAEGVERFDHVVLATHADTSLALLGDDATGAERDVLSAFRYGSNDVVLHRDDSFMPIRRRAWSSWNYLDERVDDGRDGEGVHDHDEEERVSLTYWMNRLQNLRTERPVFVTVNPAREPRAIEGRFTYRHPQFDARSVEAQRRLPSLQGRRRTWFAGAYHGSGFHEDGLRAGLAVAAGLRSPAPWWSPSEAQTVAPAAPAARPASTPVTIGAWSA
ncbi:MAG TPA: FAD-dependent oxidoreductase [Actinomycetota bacterium]|nr:FAD-dependent oxidoreductase [Actinomycetota bacterium]